MLSVVIPCKNEGESIYAVLDEIQTVLHTHHIIHEIIVVDNNSTDNTQDEAQRFGTHIRIIPCTTPGYGASILEGVTHAVYPLICKLDGDGSYNPADIPEFLNRHIKDPRLQLVIGNRFTNGNTQNMNLIHRLFGVPALNLITNLLYPSKHYVDAHCGLRLFKKDIVKNLNLTHTDFSFANEMICKALKQKLPIAQVPIMLRKDFRIMNTSKIRVLKDGFDALKTIVTLRF